MTIFTKIMQEIMSEILHKAAEEDEHVSKTILSK